MKQTNKNGIIKCHLNNSKNLAGLTFFLFFFLMICNVLAQEETKNPRLGIQAGVTLRGSNFKSGPSFSLHGGYSLFDNLLQYELMLFYDSRPGMANVDTDGTSAIGLAVGGRANIRPHEDWNPSFVLMLGIASVKEYDDLFKESLSSALCLLFSNTLYQKHMISMGMHAFLTNQGVLNPRVRPMFNIKYGFWF